MGEKSTHLYVRITYIYEFYILYIYTLAGADKCGYMRVRDMEWEIYITCGLGLLRQECAVPQGGERPIMPPMPPPSFG